MLRDVLNKAFEDNPIIVSEVVNSREVDMNKVVEFIERVKEIEFREIVKLRRM